MAGKGWGQEEEQAKGRDRGRESIGEFLWNEARFAVTDIRHKLVEEATYGHRTTPPFHQGSLADVIKEKHGIDINAPEREMAPGIEDPLEQRQEAAKEYGRVKEAGLENTLAEIEAQTDWEHSQFEEMPQERDRDIER